MPDDPVDEDEGVPGGEDVRPSFLHHRDDVRCCPYLGHLTIVRRMHRDPFDHRDLGVSGDSVNRVSSCFHHRLRRRRHRHLLLHHHRHRNRRDVAHRAPNDEDYSTTRDDVGTLRDGPDGGGSYQRSERSPV